MAGEIKGPAGANQAPHQGHHHDDLAAQHHQEKPSIRQTAGQAFEDGNLTDTEMDGIVAALRAHGQQADTLTLGELHKIDRALERLLNAGTITLDQANSMRAALYTRLQTDVGADTLHADDKVKGALAAPKALDVRQHHHAPQHATEHQGQAPQHATEHQGQAPQHATEHHPDDQKGQAP